MKRFLLLTLMFLTACSPASNTASFFNLTPAPFNLNTSSTSEQIRKALLESASHWTNLQMDGITTWYQSDGSVLQASQEKVWLDPLNSRYRVEVQGFTNMTDNVLKFSDGVTVYN